MSPERRTATAAPPPRRTRGGNARTIARQAPNQRAASRQERRPATQRVGRFARRVHGQRAASARNVSATIVASIGQRRFAIATWRGQRASTVRDQARSGARPASVEHRPTAAHRAQASRDSRASARVHALGREAPPRKAAARRPDQSFVFPILKFNKLDTIMAIHIDQIRKTLALIPLLGIRIRPLARQRKNKK
ncbi:zinc finger CCCH domain-containing protein 45-like [Dorcoceras hygrometricum]|uniref:Zinc finger CCCH domain-containing protein 45-like n=1 Tax=Dorcoceras hygrometricum TaxID=472368 RepID=A0A2Z6ZV30_9LAMI|nr:zinc finger CCCH domain-containing protein 45-like [Dorcoceras hygrometricum]